MSDAVSALGGVEYDGVVSVSENALQGMITLRCDLTAPILKETLLATLGLDVPGMRAVLAKDKYAVAWMSPDELFLFVPYESAGEITATLSEGLGQTHNLVVNVSDARAVFAFSNTAGGSSDTTDVSSLSSPCFKCAFFGSLQNSLMISRASSRTFRR